MNFETEHKIEDVSKVEIAPVVQAVLGFKKPIIAYINEPEHSTPANATRVVAMAFKYTFSEDKTSITVEYGASIFHRLSKKKLAELNQTNLDNSNNNEKIKTVINENFCRAQIRHSAEKRFTKSPVKFEMIISEDESITGKMKHENIVQTIRKTMYSLGVKSKN